MSQAIELEGVAIDIVGVIIPPDNMIEAARMSLSKEHFSALMGRIGGRAPTPRELCDVVDDLRAKSGMHVRSCEEQAAIAALPN